MKLKCSGKDQHYVNLKTNQHLYKVGTVVSFILLITDFRFETKDLENSLKFLLW